ncbi:MAG TPA: beta-propeller fold lactonase family protein [Candidatus Acidoferrales bacterium]|nr:beta-propeller fold lactonase family protein [Candidatus Acidoferrales bacterium]
MNRQAVLVRISVILGIASLVFLAGCGRGTTSTVKANPNPTPTITTISPNSAVAGGAPFTLTINGTNFVAASMVNFGGTALTTTFVSSAQLTAAIPATAIASASTAIVTVTSPAPGGGTSNAVNFTISAATTNPLPSVISLIPNCAPVGAQAFNLLASGSNFLASSVVQWNGSDLPTTFLGAFNGALWVEAQVPANDIAVSGVAAVTVFNPPPGGGSSNTANLTITATGVGPQSIAVDPTGSFAYVADNGCPDAFAGSVSMYAINATTGLLTSIGSPIPADFGPHSVAVDPMGKFAYVANDGAFEVNSGSVLAYSLDSTTGTLTQIGAAACVDSASVCLTPYSIVVHPSGKFAYVADEGGFAPTNVSMFTIDTTTGTLTSNGTIAAGGRAIAVSVDPSGKFLYAATSSDAPGSAGNISMYTINGTTGALTSIGTIPAGTDPTSVAEDPTGKFAYVTNSTSNNVSMYTINATTGALTSIGVVAAGTGCSSVAVDPTGKFAYVTNSGSNDVSMYTINATTGALTSIGTIAAGSSPASIAIRPSGNFAYVANSGSNNISMYSIDAATGVLTLIGTIGS